MKDGGPRSAREWAASFADERPPVEDFWHVYESQLDSLREAMFEWARIDSEFGPLLAPMTAARLLETKQRAHALLGQAMAGTWNAYLADLRQTGATLAEHGVGIRGWYELARVFRRHLLPHLV